MTAQDWLDTVDLFMQLPSDARDVAHHALYRSRWLDVTSGLLEEDWRALSPFERSRLLAFAEFAVSRGIEGAYEVMDALHELEVPA